MTGFDEAWLANHNARMAKLRRAGTPAPPAPLRETSITCTSLQIDAGPVVWEPDRIAFTIPRAFVPLNVLLGMHWRARKRYAGGLSAEVAGLIRGSPSREPMLKARVTITRYGMKVPDRDGLYGGAKPLIDLLLVYSDTHPHGLGLITDDDPAHLDLIVNAEKAPKRAEVRTHVLIERI